MTTARLRFRRRECQGTDETWWSVIHWAERVATQRNPGRFTSAPKPARRAKSAAKVGNDNVNRLRIRRCMLLRKPPPRLGWSKKSEPVELILSYSVPP